LRASAQYVGCRRSNTYNTPTRADKYTHMSILFCRG
jgi:hypothetical protein